MHFSFRSLLIMRVSGTCHCCVYCQAKAAAEREAARKWKAAAKEARESQLKELAEGSSSEEEPPQGTMSWRHV